MSNKCLGAFAMNALIVAAVICVNYQAVTAIFDFPAPHNEISQKDRDYLNSITSNEWRDFVESGIDSINKHKRLEANLLNSQITVANGSLSHAQLLDSLPNQRARDDNEVALKILKSSLYAYNTKCVQRGISGAHCEAFLNDQLLPERSGLREQCEQILESPREGHYTFRRLLPRYYKDGLYEMFPEEQRSAPRLISGKAMDDWNAVPGHELFDDKQKNLALVQWAQFIEHDLSKPVVPTMSNGEFIECCSKDNYKLQPRFYHPACAPLLAKDETNKYGRETCLNYVRSALAVGSKCTFGAAEKLNQASANLDLSQLYGFTGKAQYHMRTLKNGQIKSTQAEKIYQQLLPMANFDSSAFCALQSPSNNSLCFMAGDSRVNNNPFAIVIYTLFMRNHNQIANKLRTLHPDWDDEHLYQVSRAINIDIYRRIVFEEWLPALLGKTISEKINTERPVASNDDQKVSNEFGVAAMRFYFSMMPNALHNYAAFLRQRYETLPAITDKSVKIQVTNDDELIASISSNILPHPNIFVLKDEIYNPQSTYTARKVNDILVSLLHQTAMKMDATYVESLVPNTSGSTRPTHADILAFDIQRGRDHGVQPYVKYLEVCNKVSINDWEDLERFIAKGDLTKLRSVYSSYNDIDLVVGGISELPVADSTVGPTFTCILAEQFSKIRLWQDASPPTTTDLPELQQYKSITAADFLCANSEVDHVPQNIFQLSSEKNPLRSCAGHTEALRG